MARNTNKSKKAGKKSKKPEKQEKQENDAPEETTLAADKPATTTTKPKPKRKSKKTKKVKVDMAGAKQEKAAEKQVSPAIADPVMWASHQSHAFATDHLERLFKFTHDRLVALMRDVYHEDNGDVIEANCALVLGKKPVKIRRIKDPNKPKRPPTAYQLFCKDYHASSKTDKPTNLIALSKEQSKRWHGLGPTEKKVFEERAEALKSEYKNLIEAYDASKRKVITEITVS